MPAANKPTSPWAGTVDPSATRSLSSTVSPSSTGPQRFNLLVVGDARESGSPEELSMSDPTREEYDAKLEAVEARLETRLVSIDGKLDRLFDKVELAVGQSAEARTAANDARKAATEIKWHIIFTALATLGILLAAWAIWAQGVEMVGTLLSTPRPN